MCPFKIFEKHHTKPIIVITKINKERWHLHACCIKFLKYNGLLPNAKNYIYQKAWILRWVAFARVRFEVMWCRLYRFPTKKPVHGLLQLSLFLYPLSGLCGIIKNFYLLSQLCTWLKCIISLFLICFTSLRCRYIKC
jgi:hypothetical protein